MPLHAYAQEDFVAAFLDPWAPVPMPALANMRLRAKARFPNQHSQIARLFDILAARFPVVRRLAGEDSFNAVARQFIVSEPPPAPPLLHYGDGFPRFLRSIDDTPSIEYLADIAELEMTRGKAYRAREASPLPVQSFSRLSARQFEALTIVLHPSASVIVSRFPITTIWEANQSDGDYTILCWKAESVLVARPFRRVEMRQLPSGGHTLLSAISGGATLAAAIEAAAREPEFDVGLNLTMLIESNIVVELRLKS